MEILWTARNKKNKHAFTYFGRRKVIGQRMKTVWRDVARDKTGFTGFTGLEKTEEQS